MEMRHEEEQSIPLNDMYGTTQQHDGNSQSAGEDVGNFTDNQTEHESERPFPTTTSDVEEVRSNGSSSSGTTISLLKNTKRMFSVLEIINFVVYVLALVFISWYGVVLIKYSHTQDDHYHQGVLFCHGVNLIVAAAFSFIWVIVNIVILPRCLKEKKQEGRKNCCKSVFGKLLAPWTENRIIRQDEDEVDSGHGDKNRLVRAAMKFSLWQTRIFSLVLVDQMEVFLEDFSNKDTTFETWLPVIAIIFTGLQVSLDFSLHGGQWFLMHQHQQQEQQQSEDKQQDLKFFHILSLFLATVIIFGGASLTLAMWSWKVKELIFVWYFARLIVIYEINFISVRERLVRSAMYVVLSINFLTSFGDFGDSPKDKNLAIVALTLNIVGVMCLLPCRSILRGAKTAYHEKPQKTERGEGLLHKVIRGKYGLITHLEFILTAIGYIIFVIIWLTFHPTEIPDQSCILLD